MVPAPLEGRTSPRLILVRLFAETTPVPPTPIAILSGAEIAKAGAVAAPQKDANDLIIEQLLGGEVVPRSGCVEF
ncbi:hypothetical protein FQN54_001934 [Arachnomyces sp. PD_36]|nr:hypothetical protein FQN54_001934 [Arachnomyces sp. PD_36]